MNIENISSRAQMLACKFGYSDFKEDISQEVLTGFLAKESHQTVEQSVIDWMRKNGKRTRRGLKNPNFNTTRLVQAPFKDQNPGIAFKEFDSYLKRLDNRDRCIAVLRYVWGFDTHEIAYCFGFTPSMVSKRIKVIHQKIKGHLKYGTS